MNAHATNSSGSSLRHHVHRSDLHGIGRVYVSAFGGLIDVVEETHMRLIGEGLAQGALGRISRNGYTSLRTASDAAGRWVDALLAPSGPAREQPSSAEREAVLAALNGVFGDRLAEAGNPLAIPMRLRRGGRALELSSEALAREVPGASGKLLVLVHGLCRGDLQWRRDGHDHGAALANELGYTALYLQYNSGQHISLNGREFARLLDELVTNWPVEVEELTVIGHSLGGLVARSACHYGKQARHAWPGKLRHLVFLGTPHHGVPLERGGNWLVEMVGSTTLTAPLARFARLRSAGITDLRYGSLLDEDWHGRDRFAHAGDQRQPVPLPRGVKCYAIAGATGQRPDDLRNRVLGDGIIPLATALGLHHTQAEHTLRFHRSRQWIAFGMHHLDLLSHRDVYDKLKGWLGPPAT